jgi:hypothetical protein
MHRALALLILLPFAAACSETPASPTEVSHPPFTAVFASEVLALGTASRSFTAGSPGTVDVTMTATTPAGVGVGVGVGIPRSTANGCLLSHSAVVVAGAAPQLTMPVDAGEFCVQVYEVGVVERQLGFSVTIRHP